MIKIVYQQLQDHSLKSKISSKITLKTTSKRIKLNNSNIKMSHRTKIILQSKIFLLEKS